MQQNKLKELISTKHIVIPMYILKEYQNFKLNIDEFVLLLYLLDKDKEVFDPSDIASSLSLDLEKVMENISSLVTKGLINIATNKNSDGIIEEVIDLSYFYDAISLKLMEKINQEETNNLDIHKMIEEEFKRELSSFEHEMIDRWIKDNYPKELIKEALKEAILNGVTSLRYIDKILYDWQKNGIKKKEDIEKEKPEQIEIYNCDWLEDEEEI